MVSWVLFKSAHSFYSCYYTYWHITKKCVKITKDSGLYIFPVSFFSSLTFTQTNKAEFQDRLVVPLCLCVYVCLFVCVYVCLFVCVCVFVCLCRCVCQFRPMKQLTDCHQTQYETDVPKDAPAQQFFFLHSILTTWKTRNLARSKYRLFAEREMMYCSRLWKLTI